MRRTLLAFGAALLAAPLADAATLQPTDVRLSDPSVRLSNLFQGVMHDQVIGPAPDPGGRIVVQSAQLAAIARQFGVDWRPSGEAERVVLERPGQLFPRQRVLDALHKALAATGIPVNSDVETPAFNPPMVPLGASAQADVTEAVYEPVSSRFTALLSITADGMQPYNARLSGHVQEMVDLLVTTRRIAPGEVLGADDVQPARVRAGLVRSEPARLAGQVVGMAAQHPLNAGAPVLLTELSRPMMVLRGSAVQVQLDRPGLAITIEGVAMDAAALGDAVHVLNPGSRAVMTGQVIGTSLVRVVGGSSPVQLPPGAPVPPPPPARLAGR